ncbi:MAG: hypothetical protein PW789_10005 [Edaphobacter sp.]|uniref:hypothetical protein n=1 Tax=Edaphobacter sp. TaxID=1934404 RepID=UPI00238B30BC|nr:hypothetical protein [Edaphobacter sp.]MDE1176925.1 hypothetical protein [Edaphobacter sp.]
MAATATFTCVCGVQKKATNHWILARVTSNSIQFMPWDWNLALCDDIIILCGEGCAAALLSRSLGEWKELPAGMTDLSSASFSRCSP